jgi:hypothetical protein
VRASRSMHDARQAPKNYSLKEVTMKRMHMQVAVVGFYAAEATPVASGCCTV